MIKLVVCLLFLVPLAVSAARQAKPKPSRSRDAASVIVAMERAALDRSLKGDPDGFLEISDPDVTYFDPFLDKPIYGLDALAAYYHKNLTGQTAESDEFLNARVQVAGDTAVLTFNYNSHMKDGRVNRWNTTEVYRRTAKGWRIIHTHWSLLQPQKAEQP